MGRPGGSLGPGEGRSPHVAALFGVPGHKKVFRRTIARKAAPFAAISPGFAAMSWSRSTLPGVCRRPQEEARLPRVLIPSE